MLQQEQAKAFFANYDSKKLYSLVMDGTPISITKEDYQEAKNMSVEFKVKVRIILQGTEVLNDGWGTSSLILRDTKYICEAFNIIMGLKHFLTSLLLEKI